MNERYTGEPLLIGDVGGTTSDWAFITDDQELRFKTNGYNPSSQSEERLQSLVSEVRARIDDRIGIHIKYYGAGDKFRGAAQGIKAAFKSKILCQSIDIQSDLLGAARALCQTMPGVVAILGTGSNICHYDGKYIDQQGVTLGYPLGDEGSGSDIGARLVRAFYYDELPSALHTHLRQFLPADRYDFLKLYKQSEAPNQLLASYVRLLTEFRQLPAVKELICKAFEDFVFHHILPFKTYHKIHFAGSIAFYFCDELEDVLQRNGREVGLVLKEPLPQLIKYHTALKKIGNDGKD